MRLSLLITAAVLSACGALTGASQETGFVPIHAIQGPGPSSPYSGRVVTTAGIVSGDFQDNDADAARNLGGFFIQAQEFDDDPQTSEGLFVYDGGTPGVDVNPGDIVSVTGTVTEFFGETQLAAGDVSITGRGRAEAIDLSLPAESLTASSDGRTIADLERVEGMLVRLPQTLTVASLYSLERYGEVSLAAGGRWYAFTGVERPDPERYAAHRQAFAAAMLTLDDGRRGQFESPVAYADPGDDCCLRVGDAVTGLSGVIRYSRGSGGAGAETFRLEPVGKVAFERRNPRPPVPQVNGSLRIAAYNTLNLFSTVDGPGAACGPDGNGGCRGADSPAELQRQLAKSATALARIDADIVGLLEVENNGGKALEILVAALGSRTRREYRYVETGIVGTDAITAALIYDANSVAAAGGPAILDSAVDARFDTRRSRPAVAQTFRRLADGAVFTVVAIHLKSKSPASPCTDDGDPDTGDGQENCNLTRTRAVQALTDWLAADPTGSGDPDVVVLGDFNADLFEDPLEALRAAGFRNLQDPSQQPYSYVYEGRSGSLDHVFVSPSLLAQVAGFAAWHINADEAELFDYNLENGRDPVLFDPDSPYRATDHDPLIAGFDLTD